MKNSILIFLGVFSVIYLSPLQVTLAQIEPGFLAQQNVVYFTGVVVSKSGSGSRATIAVVNNRGEKKSFSIRSGTAVTALRFNKGKHKITAADIKEGNKVSVRISTDPRALNKVQAVIIVE